MRCRYCDKDKPKSAFEVAATINGKVYRRRKCGSCKQTQQKGRRKSIKAWFVDLKKTLRCRVCGNDDHRVLEFHHEDGDTKAHDVSVMVGRGLGRANIMKEISKCVVLCANCHRIEHYVE